MWNQLWHIDASSVQWSAAVAGSLAGAVVDLCCQRIPNLLSAAMLLGGVCWGIWSGGAWGLASSLLGVVLLAAPYVVMFLVGGGGAGDAKLMGAVGACLGLRDGILALGAVLGCGALLGIAWALLRGRGGQVLGNVLRLLGGLGAVLVARQGWRHAQSIIQVKQEQLRIRYGPAIFLGVVLSCWGANLWH